MYVLLATHVTTKSNLFFVTYVIYDQFQQIVQKLISITNYECNVKAVKTVLMRMDVLKNSNFHYVHDVS